MEGQTQQNEGTSSSEPASTGRLRVGCALLQKKVSRYLTPAMLEAAARRGIDLVQIDPSQPLQPQGPFNAIIHKLRPNRVWEHNLVDYLQSHPRVTVIDRLDRIRTLQNRGTMLTPLRGGGIVFQQPRSSIDSSRDAGAGSGPDSPHQHQQQQQQGQVAPPVRTARVQAPKQVEIMEGMSEADAQAALAAAGLSPPLLCKPLWTDGREGSHGLAVLHNMEAFGRLLKGDVANEFQPPLVVQQFVEHGGVLYKVYVVGDKTVVMRRPSLGETYLESEKGVQQLPRISCVSVYTKKLLGGKTSSGGGTWLPPNSAGAGPPEWVTHQLAAELRKRLGMLLFNFDLIAAETPIGPNEACYYVVDINYFPGVDKIPGFEQLFVDFLYSACTAGMRWQSAASEAGPAGSSGKQEGATAAASGLSPLGDRRSSFNAAAFAVPPSLVPPIPPTPPSPALEADLEGPAAAGLQALSLAECR